MLPHFGKVQAMRHPTPSGQPIETYSWVFPAPDGYQGQPYIEGKCPSCGARFGVLQPRLVAFRPVHSLTFHVLNERCPGCKRHAWISRDAQHTPTTHDRDPHA